eukprot:5980633-Pyramimonas_sp.AAC.1
MSSPYAAAPDADRNPHALTLLWHGSPSSGVRHRSGSRWAVPRYPHHFSAAAGLDHPAFWLST